MCNSQCTFKEIASSRSADKLHNFGKRTPHNSNTLFQLSNLSGKLSQSKKHLVINNAFIGSTIHEKWKKISVDTISWQKGYLR